MNRLALIGDIHGCLPELEEVVNHAVSRAHHLVFLGDYVNRGTNSRGVLEYLVNLSQSPGIKCSFLYGNHDHAFLRALLHGELDVFLRIGGAATIASYLSRPHGDILTQLRNAVPTMHVDFLRALLPSVRLDGVIATHSPDSICQPSSAEHCFRVYGHHPQARTEPTITKTEAFIDTGCGTTEDGRLTCLFWPQLNWFQSTMNSDV